MSIPCLDQYKETYPMTAMLLHQVVHLSADLGTLVLLPAIPKGMYVANNICLFAVISNSINIA